MKRWTLALVGVTTLALVVDVASAQPPAERERRPQDRPERQREREAREPGDRAERPRGPEDRGPGRGFGRMQMPLMLALDADRDGEISAEEIKNAVAALKKLDRDGNGKLTQEELRPQFGGPGGFGGRGGPGFVERAMRMDRNKDGKIDKSEMPEPMQRMFERLDANGDGAIDKAEVEAAAERIQRGRGGPPRDGGRGDRPGGRGGRPDGSGGDRPQRSERRDRPAAE